MSIFGWLTMRQAKTYTRTIERKRMAGDAMGWSMRQEPKDGTKSPHLSKHGGPNQGQPLDISRYFKGWCPGKDSNLHDLSTAST